MFELRFLLLFIIILHFIKANYDFEANIDFIPNIEVTPPRTLNHVCYFSILFLNRFRHLFTLIFLFKF